MDGLRTWRERESVYAGKETKEEEGTNGSFPEGDADILGLESLDEDGESKLLVRLEEVVARKRIRRGGSLRVGHVLLERGRKRRWETEGGEGRSSPTSFSFL